MGNSNDDLRKLVRRLMIDRIVTPTLLRLASWYPVVTLTGPRQSGKTTLCRQAFPNKR